MPAITSYDPENPIEKHDATKWIFATSNNLENYIKKNNVLRPGNVEFKDIPTSNNEKVREIDEEAHEIENYIGKWILFVDEDIIDNLFSKISECIKYDKIWRAKVSVNKADDNKHVVIVYTPNYFDKNDVDRVCKLLKNDFSINSDMYYKPDVYTMKNIYPDTAQQKGLPGEYRYID